jgi:hypothetical protein
VVLVDSIREGIMKQNDFEILVAERFRICKEILLMKGEEYSRHKNPLHNFYRAAEIQCLKPEDALIGMLSKHLASILDMVDDLPRVPVFHSMRDKISDSINYLVLLEAMFVDRINDELPPPGPTMQPGELNKDLVPTNFESEDMGSFRSSRMWLEYQNKKKIDENAALGGWVRCD